MRKALRLINDIIFYILFIFLLLIVFNLFVNRVIKKSKAPRFFNYYVFKIASGSMEDTLKVGDTIIVKKADSYREGDIITFTEKEHFVTHRIMEIKGDNYITKGDANNLADTSIKKEQILGKYVKTSKVLSFVIKYKYIIILAIIFISLIFNVLLKEEERIS